MVLTRRQFEVLAFLDSFTRERGYCPSFDEIGKSLNLSSLATVHKHINTLEAKGFIRRGYNQSRSIEVVNRQPLELRRQADSDTATASALQNEGASPVWELPLLGRIAAGRPLEAVPQTESLSLKDFAASQDVFVLKVKGDSMIEDHICDEDFVIVQKTSVATDGDTIVALIDSNEATLKKFFREHENQIRLQPANANMEPIFVKEEDLKIQGRVIGVLRKY